MTIEDPIWLQNLTYPARIDRGFVEAVLHSAERVFEGLAVSEASVPDFTVDVAIGRAAIMGDDQADQGMYLVNVTATENVSVPASPGSGTRTDTVILRVNDAQAGGAGTPADSAVVEVIEGTTVPATAIALATIARTSSESAILDAAITDVRPLGTYPYTVSASSPPAGVGVEGDLWVVVV